MRMLPNAVEGLTPEFLTAVISDIHPGTIVTKIDVLEVRLLGKQVSTAGRVRLRLQYAEASPALPERVLVKMVINEPAVPGVLYETEVQVYRRMLSDLDICRPICLAAAYEPSNERFILILEDLSVQNAFFPTVLEPPLSATQVAKLLDWLATLHAHYWRSPLLERERDWLSGLTDGKQFEFFNVATAQWIDGLIVEDPWRGDLIRRLGRSPAQLWESVKAVHRHHENTLPITLLHGDTGAHNSYHLPNGNCGYLDWQLAVRGTWPHDVHYLVCTALSVADRRAHERDLVKHYLVRLRHLGVTHNISLDEAMLAFSRALIWGFTIGWMMVPMRNYGAEIIHANLERLYTACDDHDTFVRAEQLI